MRAGLRQRAGPLAGGRGYRKARGRGGGAPTHPLQHDDVAVRELPSHRVHHVLAESASPRTPGGDHRPTVVKVRSGLRITGPAPRQWADGHTHRVQHVPVPLTTHGGRVAAHGALLRLSRGSRRTHSVKARDEPHAVHGAVQRRGSAPAAKSDTLRSGFPGHGAGHDARLGVGVGEGGRVSRWRWLGGGRMGRGAFRTLVWAGGRRGEPGPLWQRGRTGVLIRVPPASPALWPSPGVSDGIQKLGSALSLSLLCGPADTRVGHRLQRGRAGMPHPQRHLWDPPPPTCRLISLSHLGCLAEALGARLRGRLTMAALSLQEAPHVVLRRLAAAPSAPSAWRPLLLEACRWPGSSEPVLSCGLWVWVTQVGVGWLSEFKGGKLWHTQGHSGQRLYLVQAGGRTVICCISAASLFLPSSEGHPTISRLAGLGLGWLLCPLAAVVNSLLRQTTRAQTLPLSLMSSVASKSAVTSPGLSFFTHKTGSPSSAGQFPSSGAKMYSRIASRSYR